MHLRHGSPIYLEVAHRQHANGAVGVPKAAAAGGISKAAAAVGVPRGGRVVDGTGNETVSQALGLVALAAALEAQPWLTVSVASDRNFPLEPF